MGVVITATFFCVLTLGGVHAAAACLPNLRPGALKTASHGPKDGVETIGGDDFVGAAADRVVKFSRGAIFRFNKSLANFDDITRLG